MGRGDLSEAEWRILEELLPESRRKPGRPPENSRDVINGILWRLRTGAAWRSARGGANGVLEGSVDLVTAFGGGGRGPMVERVSRPAPPTRYSLPASPLSLLLVQHDS